MENCTCGLELYDDRDSELSLFLLITRSAYPIATFMDWNLVPKLNGKFCNSKRLYTYFGGYEHLLLRVVEVEVHLRSYCIIVLFLKFRSMII